MISDFFGLIGDNRINQAHIFDFRFPDDRLPSGGKLSQARGPSA